MDKKTQKIIICLVLACVIAVSGAFSAIIVLAINLNKPQYGNLNIPINAQNHVAFRENVLIADNSRLVKKNMDFVSVSGNEYTITYKRKLPQFFEEMNVGEVFCVYPDSSAKESMFALGFCGKLTSKNTEDRRTKTVSFTMPELTDVFSDIYINTQGAQSTNATTTAFYPSDNVTDVEYKPLQVGARTPALTMPPAVAALELSDTLSCKYKKPKTQSLLDGYVLLADELSFKYDCELSTDLGTGIGASGKVVLEDIAAKILLDYSYDAATNTAIVRDYSLGFIAEHNMELGLKASQRVGLDQIKDALGGPSLIPQIIEIEDVTASEDGKIVLGTYLIGLQATLPILYNDTNEVSYLSIGIAIQLSVTAGGQLTAECSIDESGFMQVEVNGNGNNTYLLKGEEFPNPTVDARQPTEEEFDSVPTVTAKLKGTASLNAALGVDIGLCVLGMVPVKCATNIVEFELDKSFVLEKNNKKKITVLKNNYLLDDNVDLVMVSSNSNMKMHLGAKINFGPLSYKVGEMGGSIQIFKHVWYQNPPAIGFSHSQCGFGGVFVGETYTNDELAEAYKNYMKDTGQSNFINSARDMLIGSALNSLLNDLRMDIFEISEQLDSEVDNYKYDFYSSGILYVRDSSDKVVMTLIIGEDVANAAGVHNGLSSKKIEQLYSAPHWAAEAELQIGSIAALFGIQGIESGSLAECGYNSSDSSEKIEFIFADDALKAIIVTSE